MIATLASIQRTSHPLPDQAARGLIAWFLGKGFSDRSIAFTHPENFASQHVLRKAGMREIEPRLIDGFVAPTFEIGASDIKA